MNKELKDLFAPYKQALELKELGFDEPCFMFYNPDGHYLDNGCTNTVLTQLNGGSNIVCSAPLYQQAFRWFREKYGLCGAVGWIKSEGAAYSIMNDELVWEVDVLYPTYEEAELACLNKLIEIAKNK